MATLQTAGDAPLLATKLFVPPRREKLVSRARLLERLAAMPGGRVTLIAAAAGSGKSTLLADWAIQAPGRVAWLSLDPLDDEPRRFLSYLIAALRGVDGIDADAVPEAVPAGEEAVRTVVTQLLNAVTARGGPLSLVLDDYHSIHARAVHEVVQFVLDHLPPNLHLLIATRVDPPLALSRLRARGLLLELRGADLRFNAEEAGAFLNGAMGLSLGRPAVEELERRTEGWVVGLQMAAISLAGRAGANDFIERFSGSNRYVLDYLTDEVLDRQPDDVRRFLLATSILTRLNASLCAAVTGAGDSEAILAKLEAANLFLIPLDDVRIWYRYHHLFATLLQHQLARAFSADEVRELHRRATEWYLANQMPEPALEHALAAKDVEGAAAILSTHALPRTLCGDAASALRWFDAVPRERIEGDFNLLLIRTVASIADYQLVQAAGLIERAEKLLVPDSPPGLRGAFLGVRGSLRRMMGHPDQGTADLREAHDLVEPDTFWFTMASFQLGMTAMLRADADGVVESLADARSRHSRPEQVIVAVLAQTFTAYAEWWRGNPERSIALAREMFGWIDITEMVTAGRPLDAFPNTVLAEVHLSWNDLEPARAYAEKGIEHGRRGLSMGLFDSTRALARVAEAQRDWETASRMAAEAARTIRNIGGHLHWFYSVDALAHRILLRRGQLTGSRADIRAAERWLETNRILEVLMPWENRRIAGLHCDTPLLLAVRVFIENGRWDDALTVVEEVRVRAEETSRRMTRTEALILRALVEARSGRVDDGVATMTDALELAAGPRYIRLFADEGSAVVPLVERAAAGLADRDFVTRVLAAFDLPARAAATGTPDALSEREVEVLRIVAAGASNQETARKLFIAPGTVKKHLENIYAKLHVGGRTEAIARARELKFL